MAIYTRCPQCGQLNNDEEAKLKRCPQCHTDLLRCDNCRHFENNQCNDLQAQIYYIDDGEAAKNCPQFTSKLTEKVTNIYSPLAATLWVPASLAIVIAMIIWTVFVTNPSVWASDANAIQMEISAPAEVSWNKSFPVTITLTSACRQESPPIFIEFDESVLVGGMPTPEPVRSTHEQGRMVLEYLGLPPAGRMVVTLPVTPRQLGVAPFRARLYSPRIRLRESIATDIKVIRQVTKVTNGGIEP